MKHNMDQRKIFDRSMYGIPIPPAHPLKTYPVESTKGVYIILMDGTMLIDGMSSWWAVSTFSPGCLTFIKNNYTLNHLLLLFMSGYFL